MQVYTLLDHFPKNTLYIKTKDYDVEDCTCCSLIITFSGGGALCTFLSRSGNDRPLVGAYPKLLLDLFATGLARSKSACLSFFIWDRSLVLVFFGWCDCLPADEFVGYCALPSG